MLNKIKAYLLKRKTVKALKDEMSIELMRKNFSKASEILNKIEEVKNEKFKKNI